MLSTVASRYPHVLWKFDLLKTFIPYALVVYFEDPESPCSDRVYKVSKPQRIRVGSTF